MAHFARPPFLPRLKSRVSLRRVYERMTSDNSPIDLAGVQAAREVILTSIKETLNKLRVSQSRLKPLLQNQLVT
jgi:hypothetical protein